mgnify:CR=1 FL=1|tara:strand:+ start:2991 stop:3542 length:552 start_codon:yes stop_codon:yes gene_type:complete
MLFSCNNDSKPSLEELKKRDAEKTTELLTQIFENEKDVYLATNCISEKPRATYQPNVPDFDEYIKEHLSIKDSTHYKLQTDLYKQFSLITEYAKGKNIITASDFKEFEQKSESGGFSFWDWLENNCSDGYSSISKPIFNEDYTLAYIRVGNICGELCGGGEERIYEYQNGKWILKEYFGNWIS